MSLCFISFVLEDCKDPLLYSHSISTTPHPRKLHGVLGPFTNTPSKLLTPSQPEDSESTPNLWWKHPEIDACLSLSVVMVIFSCLHICLPFFAISSIDFVCMKIKSAWASESCCLDKRSNQQLQLGPWLHLMTNLSLEMGSAAEFVRNVYA